MTLLRNIQDAALDSKTSLPDLLRRCKVLAARLNNEEFGTWVDHELRGYPDAKEDEDSLPEYRKIKVIALGHFSGPFGSSMRNVTIPPGVLPKELRHWASEHAFFASAGELEAMAANAKKGVMHGKWPGDMIAFIQHRVEIFEGMVLSDAWKMIPKPKIVGILDTIRTRVLEFALAVENEEPLAGDAAPGEGPKLQPQTVTKIFNRVVVHGGVASVGNTGDSTIRTGSVTYSAGISAEHASELARMLSELRNHAEATVADASDRDEALAALRNVETQLAKPKPLLERINNNLAIYASIVTVASPTLTKLQEYLPVALAFVQSFGH